MHAKFLVFHPSITCGAWHSNKMERFYVKELIFAVDCDSVISIDALNLKSENNFMTDLSLCIFISLDQLPLEYRLQKVLSLLLKEELPHLSLYQAV